MTALCVGRDPEWWTPEHEQARLAMLICARCTGCPGNDDAPHGVIRHGVAYSDAGRVLPVCGCGRPCPDYAGGTPRCAWCADPKVSTPRVGESRARWMVKLSARGLSNAQIGAQAGIGARTVAEARYRWVGAMIGRPS